MIMCHALISQGLLKRCHSASATYLFQQDKFYDLSLDIGDKSLQCSRKVDCLKLWLMWKAVGSSGLEERINKAFVNARYAVSAQHYAVQITSSLMSQENRNLVKVCLFCRYFLEEMKKRKGFYLLHEVTRSLKIKYISSLGFFFNYLSFSVTSQSFWTSASGSYHQICGGRKEIQITKKNWPKWVFRQKHEVSVIYPDFNPLDVTIFKCHFDTELNTFHSSLPRWLQPSKSAWWKKAAWWSDTNLWKTKSTFSAWLFCLRRFARKIWISVWMKLKGLEMTCKKHYQ